MPCAPFGRRGDPVAIATGRGPKSAAFIERESEGQYDYLILLNGQIIFRHGKKVHEAFITLPSLRRILQRARSLGFAYGGYAADGEIVDHVNKRVETVWRDFQCPLPAVLPRFDDRVPLYQGHLYVTEEEAAEFGSDLDDYLINWSHRWMLNLFARNAGKSAAIRWLIRETGIPRERVYAFGDGFNDVDMLQAAGRGIAMGNAVDEVKRAADFVTGKVEEDGIRCALQFYGVL